MQNVLVTGGAGFIGSHLVENLLKESGNNIIVVDDFNNFYSSQIKRKNIKNYLSDERFKLFETDIRRLSAMRRVFEHKTPDIIVHLAARAGVRPSLEEPVLYTETNINGTLNLLELAREFEVEKFVFGSSSSVYGLNAETPFTEDAPIAKPLSPYAATKAAGELLCHTYSHLYGMQIVCLRFFTVYGARQRPDLAIHKFTRLIDEEKPIPVFGDGTTRRDYTYIADILDGIRKAMNYKKTNYEIFNLGESRTVKLCELIDLLEKNLGKKAIINRLPMQPGDMPETFANIEKSREILDYNPTTSIEQGIEKFVCWYKTQQISI